MTIRHFPEVNWSQRVKDIQIRQFYRYVRKNAFYVILYITESNLS